MTQTGESREVVQRIESDEFTEEVLSQSITLLTTVLVQTDPVAQAIMALLPRIGNTWTSIHALSRHADSRVRNRSTQDIGALFRIIFEAYIQLAYILHDPKRREELASLYLDFGFVERMKRQHKILRHDSNLAKLLGTSPKRAEGEPALQKEFARISDRFRKFKKRSSTGLLKLSDIRDH